MPAVKTGGLTATQLKYLAAVFMVIDHIGMLFTPLAPVFPADDLRYYAFRYLGRLAFPIFAYFVAEGCRHTHNYPAYLKRLFLFALLTQLPLVIFLPGGGRSIVVTFFLAALGIGFWENLRQQGRVFPAAGALILCVLAAQPLQGDYGWLGAATVAAVYLAGTDRRRQLITLGGCLALHYLFVPLWSYWGPALTLLPSGGWAAFLLEAEGRLPYFQDFYLPYSLLMTAFACLTLPLLARYDGRRGNGSRWFFYWFYPGHLIVLGGIQILMTL